MSEAPFYMITEGINDRPIKWCTTLEKALDYIADIYYPDEILLRVVEIKVLLGDHQIDCLSSIDVHAEIIRTGRCFE